VMGLFGYRQARIAVRSPAPGKNQLHRKNASRAGEVKEEVNETCYRLQVACTTPSISEHVACDA
jgi:hypothetical protein